MRLPREEVMIIATGGQGEPRAALGRIALGNHELKLASGDTVIFSTKIIPGNEVAIGRIMNALSDLGALIVTERQAHVHVSGHPGRPELKMMYEWIRPQIVVPVHGEPRHLAEHARFARASGVPDAIVTLRPLPSRQNSALDRGGQRRPRGQEGAVSQVPANPHDPRGQTRARRGRCGGRRECSRLSQPCHHRCCTGRRRSTASG